MNPGSTLLGRPFSKVPFLPRTPTGALRRGASGIFSNSVIPVLKWNFGVPKKDSPGITGWNESEENHVR